MLGSMIIRIMGKKKTTISGSVDKNKKLSSTGNLWTSFAAINVCGTSQAKRKQKERKSLWRDLPDPVM